ncbi:unnamed protein product [Pleuronectes platessa]|uniref:Uncharacterized protein n=1 Tax=Pleuronectes platessa TaxID=8262 RepID=A0A9N7Z7G7_PLEPL|nr:unnamed protein product [Pleuronectes platessa]
MAEECRRPFMSSCDDLISSIEPTPRQRRQNRRPQNERSVEDGDSTSQESMKNSTKFRLSLSPSPSPSPSLHPGLASHTDITEEKSSSLTLHRAPCTLPPRFSQQSWKRGSCINVVFELKYSWKNGPLLDPPLPPSLSLLSAFQPSGFRGERQHQAASDRMGLTSDPWSRQLNQLLYGGVTAERESESAALREKDTGGLCVCKASGATGDPSVRPINQLWISTRASRGRPGVEGANESSHNEMHMLLPEGMRPLSEQCKQRKVMRERLVVVLGYWRGSVVSHRAKVDPGAGDAFGESSPPISSGTLFQSFRVLTEVTPDPPDLQV